MRTVKIGSLLVLLAFALAFPVLFSNPAITSIAVFTLLFAGAATGWNIFSGYTGYFSFGHAVYYGIGAYTLALACQRWHLAGGYLPFLLFPLSGLFAGLFAIPLGWIALRTRKFVFVVVTIGIFYIMQLLAYNLSSLTEGSAGIALPFPSSWGADFFNIPFYYVGLLLLLLALAVSWRIRHSKYGLGLLAIRDDEDRAQGLGVKVGAYKLSSYVVSAVFVGMAGALYAYFIGQIFPQFTFDPVFDVTVVMIVLLGGFGTLSGPIIGAVLLVPIQQEITIQLGASGLDLIFYGCLLLLNLLFLPEGIVPSLQTRWISWKASHPKAEARVNGTASQERAVLVERREV
jgi:branched-chain amino acid transport system permease protein